MQSYEWIHDLLESPFRDGAYGPDEFDCYGLYWYVNQEYNKLSLPIFDDLDYQESRIRAEIEKQRTSNNWVEVKKPQEFDLVELRRTGEAYHLGVWLDIADGRVLHATPQGVLCNKISELNLMGFKHLAYHTWKS